MTSTKDLKVLLHVLITFPFIIFMSFMVKNQL